VQSAFDGYSFNIFAYG